MIEVGMYLGIGAVVLLVLLFVAPKLILGMVVIGEEDVGVVVKKFSRKQLPPGRLVALDGEAGYQADTLGPGWHFGLFPWQFSIEKYSMIEIPAGQIGLVLANDGDPIPQNRILGKTIDCDNFQDARKFLTTGGEKGRQLGILTAGTYRINLSLFQVVDTENAKDFGLRPEDLLVYTVNTDCVGIVTAMDGKPISPGEIAGAEVPDHENFQDAQAFMTNGGKRGLQEQILLSGKWNINPWFARVEQVEMTEVPIGSVGVVISYVGKEHVDISGESFKHGDLVERGHKGVWADPLYPGKHPINPRTMKINIVPTTNLALNWATNRSEAHKLDEKLSSITVRSKDGYAFNLDVCQVIHVGAKQASRVISRFGSMKNLVDQVLEPAIGNYFRNSAQEFGVLDFLSQREARQTAAADCIGKALMEYDVEAVGTLIGDISPPAKLMETLTNRKLAEEETKTYETQEIAQKKRQALVREQSLADTQPNIVKAERDVEVSDLQAKTKINIAKGDAQAILLAAESTSKAIVLNGDAQAKRIQSIGEAKAKAYKGGVDAMGQQGYTAMQIAKQIADGDIKLIPDTLIQGSGSSEMLITGLLAKAFGFKTSEEAK